MICRICTLTERMIADPVYTQTGTDANGMPIYEQTGWTNISYVPRKNQFAINIDFVSVEGDSGFFVCFRVRRRHRRGWWYHRHAYILWRHSPNLYAVFTRRSRRDELNAAPMNGMRLRAYCNQATHGWRWYTAAGTDSATNPMTGLPIGAFTGKLVNLAAQPSATVSGTSPLVDANYPTCSITNLVPAIPTVTGELDMLATALRNTDAEDDPSETEDE